MIEEIPGPVAIRSITITFDPAQDMLSAEECSRLGKFLVDHLWARFELPVRSVHVDGWQGDG